MRLAIHPYELTTRSAAAVAALILADDADGVVTLRPNPGEVRESAEATPWLLRFVDAWTWCAPFWRDGLLRAGEGGDSPSRRFDLMMARIDADPRLSALKPLVDERAECALTALESLSRDLVRGGANPALSLAVRSSVDAFAAAHERCCIGMAMMPRPGAAIHTCFRCSIPVPRHTGARLLKLIRDSLAAELEVLRASLVDSITMLDGDSSPSHTKSVADAVRKAAEAYAGTFIQFHKDTRENDADEPALRPMEVTLSGSWVDSNELLDHAALAIRRLGHGAASMPISALQFGASAALLRIGVKPSPWDYAGASVGARPSAARRT